MAVKITGVEPRSPAEKHGIRAGDTLLSINGHEINDILDYRFYMTERRLSLSLLTAGGEEYEKRLQKREYDDLGLEFATYLMDSQHTCKNKCIFCFIDQLPEGLRESLYFKDDDSRMGFLFGNYITLTNLGDKDIERIIKMRISPVNISVHTMNPELRVKMMGNPHSGSSLRFIKQLTGAGIKVNAQLVLCPGINDGKELEFSLHELTALAPGLQSVAAAPVGLTGFREGLPELRLYTPREAADVIGIMDGFAEECLKKYGTRICFAADEFYLNAGIPFLDYESYGSFDQLENGVGLLPLLRRELEDALRLEPAAKISRNITIATGTAAKPEIEKLAKAAEEKFDGLNARVIAVENRFFGETVTVSGLVTGTDLIARLKDEMIGDELLIPAVMLRHERDLFLDGVNIDDAAKALGCKVRAVERDGSGLLDAMLGRHD